MEFSDFGPFQGKVLDMKTKEPIEGAVVLIEWRKIHFFAGSTFIDAHETLTNKNGDFYIPGIWIFNPWKHISSDTQMIIYKSEYKAIETGAWRDWEVFSPKLEYVLKVEDGKPIFLLKKLETIEERRQNIPSRVHAPKSKSKLLDQEINKERKILGY